MMAIARICVRKKNPKVVDVDYKNYMWDYVNKNHSSWKDTDVTLLYMTQRSNQEDTSLIVDIKDTNAFGEFITKYIAPLQHVNGVWLFNLIQPKFFPIPKGTPQDFQRYTVTITAKPKDYARIYKTISVLEPTKDVIVTYIAHTFQAFGQDILVSLVGRDRDTIEKFVMEQIVPIDGIRETKTTRITRTKRLASYNVWKGYIKSCNGQPYKSGHESEEFEIWEDGYTDDFVCC
jgi:DNA-binding Lrp family transcriptional regulator